RTADAIRTPAIIVIDSFDRVLDLSRDLQREQLQDLFGRLRDAHRKTRLVLVLDERQLSGIYGLEAYDPNATRAMYRLSSISRRDALVTLTTATAKGRIHYTDDFIAKLADDAVELSRATWWDTLD